MVDAGVSGGSTVTGHRAGRAARRADRAMSDLRVTRADLFDAEIRPHNERFRAVAAIDRDDRVLDIGCGTGESTRQAARVAVDGSVLGVDISRDALALARRISADEGLPNVGY